MISKASLAAGMVAFALSVGMLNTSGAVHAAANTECLDSATTLQVPTSDFLVVAPVGQTWGITERGPYSVNIPAGKYSLNYVSFDSHQAHGGGLGQQHEQWYIDAYSDGVKVFTSAITSDVPEDEDYISGLLNENVMLPVIDSVVIRHALEVDEIGTMPQSVHPVCVSFNPVNTTNDGSVLGENTDKPDGGGSVLGTSNTANNTGSVLGESSKASNTGSALGATTLAQTGTQAPVFLASLAFAISLVSGLVLAKRTNHS